MPKCVWSSEMKRTSTKGILELFILLMASMSTLRYRSHEGASSPGHEITTSTVYDV